MVELPTGEKFKAVCQKVADPRMKFSPGIPSDEYQQFKDVIRYDKSVQITNEPFHQISSVSAKYGFPCPREVTARKRRNPLQLFAESVSSYGDSCKLM